MVPYLIPEADTVEHMLAHVEAAMIAETRIKPNQQIVLICGFPVRRAGRLTWRCCTRLGNSGFSCLQDCFPGSFHLERDPGMSRYRQGQKSPGWNSRLA